jgi:hypothetical protein
VSSSAGAVIFLLLRVVGPVVIQALENQLSQVALENRLELLLIVEDVVRAWA